MAIILSLLFLLFESIFTIPRPKSFDYSFCRSEIINAKKELSENTVHRVKNYTNVFMFNISEVYLNPVIETFLENHN